MVTSMSTGDRIFKYIVNMVLVITFTVTVLPLLNLLAISLSSSDPIMRGQVAFWPIELNFAAYMYVLSSKLFLSSFRMSSLIAVLGSMSGVVLSVCAAYPLSKKTLPGRKYLVLAFVFTTMFGGGLIPSYMLVKGLHIMDSVWAVVLPAAINVFNILIAKSYFEGIPEEIEESAKIDGASYTSILVRIMVPIAVPLISVLVLFFAVDFWNEYINSRMYITSPSKMPLQLYLRSAIFEAGDSSRDLDVSAEQMKYLNISNIANALIVSAMIPIVLIYPFIQRFFITGITIGSVKG